MSLRGARRGRNLAASWWPAARDCVAPLITTAAPLEDMAVQREPLVFVGICDLAGLVRGKGFPASDLPARLRDGVGLTHSNIMMSAFGPIYETPFGTEGDLVLRPDPSTKVEVEFGEDAAERFYLADIMTMDGAHWECCPRDFLRRALAALEKEAGLILLAAFEQESVYT